MAKPLPGQPGYERRDWNNWADLDAEELAERRRILQQSARRLDNEEKEVARERAEYDRAFRQFQTKEYGFDRTIKLLTAIIGDEKPGLTLAQDTMRKLLAYVPEVVPDTVREDMTYSGQSDDIPPFFSEGFLYPLLGKDEARTLRAHIRELKDSLGMDDYV